MKEPRTRAGTRIWRDLIYGVVRGAIASQNRLARQCEVGEVPIASELGDATFFMAESTREHIRLGPGPCVSRPPTTGDRHGEHER